MTTKNLYQRIADVMQSVKYVRKDSTVRSGMETYKAVSHDAVIGALRAPMLQAGIVSTVTQKGQAQIFEGQTRKGTAKIRFQAIYEISYINIDQPDDRLVVEMEAHAEDMGDKAPGKACSYAVKTAHLKTFSLETGDDDEQRQPTGTEMQQAAPVQVIDMRETYSKAGDFLGLDPDEIEVIARNAIAERSTGGEIPPTVIALAEPLAVLVRAKLRELGKKKAAEKPLAGPAVEDDKPAADSDASPEMKAKNDQRRKAINARIGELDLDREAVKHGLKALFGIDSTGKCGALDDDEWRRVMEDLPGIVEAGK